VLCLVILLAGCSKSATLPESEMREHAQAYLDAIASGDASLAVSMMGEDSGARNNENCPAYRGLLTDEILRGSVERISDGRVVESRAIPSPGQKNPDGKVFNGTVDVAFSLAGDSHEAKLRYAYEDGRWVLIDGLAGTLSVHTHLSMSYVPFIIAGVDADPARSPLPAHPCADSFMLFPAVYHVEPQVDPTWKPRSALTEDVSDPTGRDVAVLPQSGTYVEVDFEPQRQ